MHRHGGLHAPHANRASRLSAGERQRCSVWGIAFLAVALLGWAPGCSIVDRVNAGRWIADYDRAERLARSKDKDMLILYKDTRVGEDDVLLASLSHKSVRPAVRRYIRCLLAKPYEMDRRYAAQFGVERAPALIVARRDGTCHAAVGALTPQQITTLLADANEPGVPVQWDPLVPRKPVYAWHRQLPVAEAAAEAAQRPLLVVYYRHATSDRRRLFDMLRRPEVYRRLGQLVHCRIGIGRPWVGTYITPFGTLKLPAIVLGHTNGTFDVLEMPTGYASIVRFADRCLGPPQPEADLAATSNAQSP